MIKQTTLKQIVFDKGKHLNNFNNWVLVCYDDWGGLDYEGDGTQFYEFNLQYTVGGEPIDVLVEVFHCWVEVRYDGDYYTPPYVDVENVDTDVYINRIIRDGVEVDLRGLSELLIELESHIKHDIVDNH